MSEQFEVLIPWAEADPIPLTGISPRLTDFNGKRIGLLFNYKIASIPIQDAVERKLRERFDDVVMSRFERVGNADNSGSAEIARFESWVKGQDAVILAVGD
jgi:hypothetical protein